MTQKTAQILFIVFNLLAIVAVGYAADDFVFILSAIRDNREIIPFDSGTYYLLLMSIFWILSFIQYRGVKSEKSNLLKYGNQLVIGWFLLMLLIANVIPYYLTARLEGAGYVGCDDPEEISRVSRGESFLYMKHGCR